MKLAFNVINSGLGNNGGSRTILLCQKVLEELGHTCDIIGTVDNFTWFDHKPIIQYVPSNLDAVIATACTTVGHAYEMNAKVKAWYIRGHETWTFNEDLLRTCYNRGLFNIVNSKGLQQLVASFGADSVVVYQGVDIDQWEDRKLRKDGVIRIGCLYNKKPSKRWVDFVKLAEILGDDGYEYVGIGDTMRDDNFLTDFTANANVEELNNIYSSCDMWFAPTELEGLHNVPIEAALCGCLIVCGDNPMNGMILDYAFPDNTAMVYEARNIDHAAELVRNPNWDVVDRMHNHIVTNIGSREQNMKKMIEYVGKV